MSLTSTRKAWIHAFRLRTLPLALSSIVMGTVIAFQDGAFRWSVFALAALTTTLLQVLSNLANDYGDSIHGADHDERKGPQRAVQSGAISASSMKKAMVLFSLLSLVSGLALLAVALETAYLFFLFLALGLLAIFAAITYTSGSRPYGYAGLGDLAVFLFFGWVGVMGTYYLHTLSFDASLWLPASAVGLLSTGVLNINNIRDIESDKKAGKRSIPVRIGKQDAARYHWLLLLLALGLLLAYVLVEQAYGAFLYILAAPVVLRTGWAVSKVETPEKLDPYLKVMALGTFLCVLLFGLGWMIF
ncbi:1,4-dihydroxy-2-naphthoate polyprenyltransferase [Cyclobacterium xiamenense]|uniref:1,4-dihydroxy-2-naphthoate polyprenyltransferase n=1 Tax=Cyclobacterium xiamenense TaxID=1297121 RepID=UPI0012B7EDB5|nr:1,4-dihydroxy-2-naphthoate polyprenyltransferase [Cyclobacterium xiamenense]